MSKMIQLTVEEFRETNRLIIKLIGGTDFVKKVHEYIEEEVNNAPENFVDGSRVEIPESAVDRAIEETFDNEFGEENVPTVVYEFVYENLDDDKFAEWMEQIHDMLAEEKAFEAGKYGYFGLAPKRDFL